MADEPVRVEWCQIFNLDTLAFVKNKDLILQDPAYTGYFAVTDQNGAVSFNVPLNLYKVRADYFGSQYWSTTFDWFDTDITIAHGAVSVHVTDLGVDVSGAKVYLFSETGSYLGLNSTTDVNGMADFIVPAKSYKLRVDYNSNQYWTDVVNVIAYQANPINLALDLLALNLTNNPYPQRIDGEGPVYTPQVASMGSLVGLLAQVVTQAVPSNDARTFYYISDHLSTAQLLVDDQGAVVWQGNYSPFGEVDVVVNQLENNFRFPGQYYDAEIGLHYNWNRYYDPATGRYISADPIGLEGGMNLYGYVGGNPVNYTDPMGLRTAENPYGTPSYGHHGYWCGPKWTGGYERKSWDELTDGERRNAIPPIDGMDSCCQDHDRCYGRCRDQYPCDEEARADCFRRCDRILDKCANNNLTGRPVFDFLMKDYFKDSNPGSGPNSSTCTKPSIRPPFVR